MNKASNGTHPSRKKYNAVLIGYGRMGKNHDRVLREHGGFNIAAVVDPTADLSTPKALGSKTYDSLEKLSKDDIPFDVIIVASPTATHLAVVEKALQFKLPIFIEKPLAPSFEESQKIVALAKAAGIQVFVGHTERSNPAVKKLRDVIASGIIGTPIHFSTTRVGGFPNEREGTNVLLDLAVHDLDVLSLFTGPLKLRASICHNTYDHNLPDTAQLLLTNESGVSAAVHVNWITPTKIRTLRVTGTKGVARVDYILQTCKVVGGNLLKRSHRTEFKFSDVVQDYINMDQIEFGVDKSEPLLVQANQIHEYLSVGQCDLCNAEQASQIVNLAEMAITLGQGGFRGA